MEFINKEGFHLNPNSDVVNRIVEKINNNNGECPCVNPGKTHEDRVCPCKQFRENNICRCALYLRDA